MVVPVEAVGVEEFGEELALGHIVGSEVVELVFVVVRVDCWRHALLDKVRLRGFTFCEPRPRIAHDYILDCVRCHSIPLA